MSGTVLNGMGMMVPKGMGMQMYDMVHGMVGKRLSAPLLAGGGMNAESQWHKSTIRGPDRDGLHPQCSFQTGKKQVGEILSSIKN